MGRVVGREGGMVGPNPPPNQLIIGGPHNQIGVDAWGGGGGN